MENTIATDINKEIIDERENQFELRKLTAIDIAPVTKILSRIGFTKFKDVFNSIDIKEIAKGGKNIDLTDVGIVVAVDFAGVILENYENVQDLLFDWLASVAGKEKTEIEALSLAEFAELLYRVTQKEEFKDFFKVVSKFLK